MGEIDEVVFVLVDFSGSPTCFRWRDKDYFVGSALSRWFSRSEWWSGLTAQKGAGSSLSEVEIWRLSVAEGPVFDLLHNTLTGSWKLLRQCS